MDKNFYEKYYDQFLDLDKVDEEDALSPEEVEYYISENFEDLINVERGDIVFVKTFAYSDGYIGKNHMFVIIDEDNYIPFEYFGMIISSDIKKASYKYNIRIDKDDKNKLHKDSIIKTDYVYKLKGDNIMYKVGHLDENIIILFERKYKEYQNEECK